MFIGFLQDTYTTVYCSTAEQKPRSVCYTKRVQPKHALASFVLRQSTSAHSARPVRNEPYCRFKGIKTDLGNAPTSLIRRTGRQRRSARAQSILLLRAGNFFHVARHSIDKRSQCLVRVINTHAMLFTRSMPALDFAAVVPMVLEDRLSTLKRINV